MKQPKAPPKTVQAYYQTLKEFEHQRAFHEGAVSVAFQTLLADTGRSHGWTRQSPMVTALSSPPDDMVRTNGNRSAIFTKVILTLDRVYC